MLDASIAFAKRVAQGKTQQTLGDLEQQQQKSLDELVSNLIKQQRAMLDNICNHLQTSDSESTSVLQKTGLQGLLMREGLVSPLDAVEKRREIYQEFKKNSSSVGANLETIMISDDEKTFVCEETKNEEA